MAWSSEKVLSGYLLGSAVPGSWGFGLGPSSMSFYKDIRIIGIQAGLIVTDANGAVEADARVSVQAQTDKGNSIGSFGGAGIYEFALHHGNDMHKAVQIDIPANTSITIVGSCFFYAVVGSPSQGSCFIDIIYTVKSFL